MVRVRIRGASEKALNGLTVFLHVSEESGGLQCDECGNEDRGCKRSFSLENVRKAKNYLRADSPLRAKAFEFVIEQLRSESALCFDCYEIVVDGKFGSRYTAAD
ncbi:hypothetical protein HQ571_00075 [Candidatus Kuenenbacteria bacterium]|nr:hypothetical protein [Candidatus Kuenenbacteria bacterium]